MTMLMMLKRDGGCAGVQRRGRLAFIFLLLFVCATLATAFHHHTDGSEHFGCSVCSAGQHYSSASVTVFSIANQQPVSSNETPQMVFFYDSIRVSLLPSRAPPV